MVCADRITSRRVPCCRRVPPISTCSSAVFACPSMDRMPNPMPARTYPQAVAVLAGARDHFQLPLALHEGGLLRTLLTDMYWPADTCWFASLITPWLDRK